MELSSMLSEWINCSERLPNNNDWVLCYTPNEEMFTAEYSRNECYYSPFYFDRWDSGHCCGREHMNPTHWMPLPKEPK